MKFHPRKHLERNQQLSFNCFSENVNKPVACKQEVKIQLKKKSITSPTSKSNSRFNGKQPPPLHAHTTFSLSCYVPHLLHPASRVNVEIFDANTNTLDIRRRRRASVSSIQADKETRIPLELPPPTPQLVSPPSARRIPLHGSRCCLSSPLSLPFFFFFFCACRLVRENLLIPPQFFSFGKSEDCPHSPSNTHPTDCFSFF